LFEGFYFYLPELKLDQVCVAVGNCRWLWAFRLSWLLLI